MKDETKRMASYLRLRISGVNLKYKQGRLKSLGTGRCERNKCLK